jgi:radical SAM superfamily enzyme YgiQ (UPF0313 family)
MTKSSLFIKLISPKMSLRPMDSEFKRRMSPPLSLIAVASLTPEKHNVKIADENIEALNFNDHPDVVGINVNVDTFERAKQIASYYKQKGAIIIFGGIHASANPLPMLEFCDSVCIGSADISWPKMLSDIVSGNNKKIYNYKTPDLSLTPITNRKFINERRYLYTNIVVTSRGCPHSCEFCYNSCEYVDNNFKNRPLNDVLYEIDNLKTKQVYFIDDNLIGNMMYSKKLIYELSKRNLIWHAAVSANIVHHKELIDKMAESGCRSLFIGFETINQNSLIEVSKKQNKIELYEELINYLHNKGIMVNASLAFGFDSDTKEVFKDTLKWLLRNKIETVTSHILTPYPGTKLYQKLANENRITDFNLSKYNTSNVVFKPKNMSSEDLKAGYLWVYKEFYKHKNIFKRIPSNRKNYIPFFLFNYGYRKYGKIVTCLLKNNLMNKAGTLSRICCYGIG